MLKLNEDLFDDVQIVIPEVEAEVVVDPELSGPETPQAVGESSLILDAIANCTKNIDQYNVMKANITDAEMIPVIEDIVNNENITLGKLQSLLKQVSPNAENIMNGAVEAEQQLGESLNEEWSGIYSPAFLSKNLDINKEEAKKFSIYLWDNHADEGYKAMRDIADDYARLYDGKSALEYWYDEFKNNGEIDESLNAESVNESVELVYDTIDKKGNIKSNRRSFKDEKAMETFIDKVSEKDNFYRVVATSSDSLNESRLTPAREEADSICKFLDENKFYNYDLANYDIYPMDTRKITIRVTGDWKHDHGWFKDLLNDWADKNNKKIFKVDSEEVGESDSDYYTADYSIFVAKDDDSYDTLNSMKSLFAGEDDEDIDESLKEQTENKWEDPEWRKYWGVDDDSFYDDNIEISQEEELTDLDPEAIDDEF